MEIFLIIAIFIVAFLYATAGHGGASGYLALMAISGIAPMYMKPTALMINVFVSFIAFIVYFRAGYFRWKLFLPFIITSFPLAFVGASYEIDPHIYKMILGVLLFIAASRILFSPSDKEVSKSPNILVALLFGAIIGFFSGMIGIGGGIILSPLILLFGWGKIKETATVSALFIFLNSVAGLAGTIQSGLILHPDIVFWLIAAISGGLLGAYSGSYKFNIKLLKLILSFVLVIAGFKLLFV